jgi:D-glycero-alpha-D-manno-heptose-7-phosphate kinase
MIISRTPYRLSLFGGGTDYVDWYSAHDSKVVAVAISRYCYITVRNLPPFFPHRTRVVYSQIESVVNHSDIDHPSVRACLEFLNCKDGLEIHHDGDLPARSGIGSSSAFTVGLLNALYCLRGVSIGPADLARDAVFVEQELLREPVGVQDQVISAHGGMQILSLTKATGVVARPLELSDDYRKYLEESILFGFTGVERLSTEFTVKIIASIKAGLLDDYLGEITSITNTGIRRLQQECDIRELGRLLVRNWDLKKQLSPKLTTDNADDLISTAIRAGAFGGKLMGAGGSGFFYVLADKSHHESIITERQCLGTY